MFSRRINDCRWSCRWKMIRNGKSPHITRFSSSSTLNQFQSIRLSAFECEGKYWNIFKFGWWFECAQNARQQSAAAAARRLLGENQRLKPLEQIRRVGFLISCCFFVTCCRGQKVVNEFIPGMWKSQRFLFIYHDSEVDEFPCRTSIAIDRKIILESLFCVTQRNNHERGFATA